MAGIGLCLRENNVCELRENCFRYKVEPYSEEDAFTFPQICNSENDYQWKWEIKKVEGE